MHIDGPPPIIIRRHARLCPFCGSNADVMTFGNGEYVAHDTDDQRVQHCPIGGIIMTIGDWEMGYS